jgi:hypothetical protein
MTSQLMAMCQRTGRQRHLLERMLQQPHRLRHCRQNRVRLLSRGHRPRNWPWGTCCRISGGLPSRRTQIPPARAAAAPCLGNPRGRRQTVSAPAQTQSGAGTAPLAAQPAPVGVAETGPCRPRPRGDAGAALGRGAGPVSAAEIARQHCGVATLRHSVACSRTQ